MWYDVFINLLTTLICAVVASVGKTIWLQIKNNPTKIQKPKETNRKQLVKFFFISLLIFTVSIAIGFSFPFDKSSVGIVIRPIFLFFAGISFIVVWGSFDAAMVFYPPDNIDKKPPDDTTDDSGDN